MDEARRLSVEGAPEGSVVQAGEQTAGRGRFGNTWTSPPGNLYMTLILRPTVPAQSWAQISFLIAVSLADTLQSLGVEDLSLKWPNDVLAASRKIAGILLEMGEDFLLVGIGLNVARAPDHCASLAGFESDVGKIRDLLLKNIGILYAVWLKDGFGPIRDAWMGRVHGLHAPITVRMADRKMEGAFDGIDAQGNLNLRQKDGKIININSGAVHFDPGES